MSLDLFKEIIPSLLQNDEYLLTSEETEKDYKPYIINKALSQHIDCIFHASEINQNPHLDAKLQYDYYFYSIKKYKRKYQKWMKYNESKDIERIKQYYNCSGVKAKTILSVLTKEQLKVIQERLDTGGKIANTK